MIIIIFRCKKPANAMPSKASLPSSLVEPTDATPHSLDVNSVGRQSSKLSSSRSTKPSSNSSKEDGTTGNGTTLTPPISTTKPSFLRQPFKNFRKTRSTLIEKDPESNNLMPRRPSLVVTQSSEADLLETTTNSYNSNNNNALRLPDMSITPPTTPNNTHSSFLQAPSFLKVCIFFLPFKIVESMCTQEEKGRRWRDIYPPSFPIPVELYKI